MESSPLVPAPTEQQPQQGVTEELALAYHVLKSFISDRRMEYSGERMEKMDHKDALYTDLGDLALTGIRTESPTATGEPAMPRTIIERFVDRRLDKRADKKSHADTRAHRAERVFGPRESLPGYNKSERRFGNPNKDGEAYGGFPQFRGKLGLRNRVRQGAMLASEARVLSTQIDAEPLKLGEAMHRRANRDQKTADRKVDKIVSQPITSRWRNSRRKAAINDIQRHHDRAEQHRAKRDSILKAQAKRRLDDTAT